MLGSSCQGDSRFLVLIISDLLWRHGDHHPSEPSSSRLATLALMRAFLRAIEQRLHGLEACQSQASCNKLERAEFGPKLMGKPGFAGKLLIAAHSCSQLLTAAHSLTLTLSLSLSLSLSLTLSLSLSHSLITLSSLSHHSLTLSLSLPPHFPRLQHHAGTSALWRKGCMVILRKLSTESLKLAGIWF